MPALTQDFQQQECLNLYKFLQFISQFIMISINLFDFKFCLLLIFALFITSFCFITLNLLFIILKV